MFSAMVCGLDTEWVFAVMGLLEDNPQPVDIPETCSPNIRFYHHAIV